MGYARLRRLSSIGFVALWVTGCSGVHSEFASPATSGSATAEHSQKNSNNERVVYNFTGGGDGGNAATQLALDKTGNVYGTTVVGGTYQCGTIFEAKPQSAPPWSETALYSFTCYSDGKNPHGGVTFDQQGNLDGTTVAGGQGYCAGDGCGVVFQYASGAERVLYGFTGRRDGFGPGSPLTIDTSGNIYSTTPDGGSSGVGTIYELRNGKSKVNVLHGFSGGRDGGTGSLGALLRDSSGNLYGVTETGGALSNGTVYRVTTGANGKGKLTTLYTFKGTPDAGSPYGGLAADSSGNLYGTTYYGGANGLGSLFELVRKGNGFSERVLYSFKGGNDGSSSTSTLIFGAAGTLYGTTSAGGGSCDCGTIFSFNTKSGKEKVLHGFGGANDGMNPYYGMTLESNGKFVGTTVAGGSFGQGTI
ncbi:MAG TPA: choice-of-anchor tandem repeat GloVer-containing protein, partial [Candidatus Tumulicola sp.]